MDLASTFGQNEVGKGAAGIHTQSEFVVHGVSWILMSFMDSCAGGSSDECLDKLRTKVAGGRLVDGQIVVQDDAVLGLCTDT